jgi:hypothetical protein
MKSRSTELMDKSVSAMISAIEIYNKPDFKYREETFAILAINAWELLTKAKFLKDNGNKIRSLYVMEKAKKLDGTPSKKLRVKLTSSGNPFTHSLDYMSLKLESNGSLNTMAKQNIDAMREVRDSSVHFYNRSSLFAIRLQEVGSACVKNYVSAITDWFDYDLSIYNFYLMPLAFVRSNASLNAISLNKEEINLLTYIDRLDPSEDPNSKYSVSVNVEVNFAKSKAKEALEVQLSNDPSAFKIQYTEQQFKSKYPMNYEELQKRCKERYEDCLINKEFHRIKATFIGNQRYSNTRYLDPDNSKSAKQEWYSEAVFTEFDRYYTKRDKK